jgi:hypothetical protein
VRAHLLPPVQKFFLEMQGITPDHFKFSFNEPADVPVGFGIA